MCRDAAHPAAGRHTADTILLDEEHSAAVGKEFTASPAAAGCCWLWVRTGYRALIPTGPV